MEYSRNKQPLPPLLTKQKIPKLLPLEIQFNYKSTRLNRNHSVNKQTTLPPIESVPSNYNERIEFITKLFGKDELMQICTNAPLRISSKSIDIGVYMASKLKLKTEICAALILYLQLNFTVDTDDIHSKKTMSQSAEVVFKRGCGTSEGICKLYQSMVIGAGVKIDIINGLLKSFGYQNGEFKSRHHWCLIKLATSFFYIIDPTLAIGYFDKDNAFVSMLCPFYFLTPPTYLIDTHRPVIDKYQLLDKPLSIKAFNDKPTSDIALFFTNIFHYKITLNGIPYSNRLDIVNLNYSFRISIPSYDLTIEILEEDNDDLLELITEINYHFLSETHEIKIPFPSNGNYYLIIKGTKRLSPDGKKHPIDLLKFNCIVNTKKNKKSIDEKGLLSLPNYLSHSKRLVRSTSELTNSNLLKKKCYDNKGAYLYEPKSLNLKIGQETKFKVKVKDATIVVLFDGKNKQHLKKTEDNIYEGVFPVINTNLVICSLKKANIYTEVFEFSASKS